MTLPLSSLLIDSSYFVYLVFASLGGVVFLVLGVRALVACFESQGVRASSDLLSVPAVVEPGTQCFIRAQAR